MWCAQPELCANQVLLTDKYKEATATGVGGAGDRTLQTALASYRQFLQKHQQVEYGQPIDVYAFGVTMFEMVALQPPWQGVQTDEVVRSVHGGARPEIPPSLEGSAPGGWCELMRACWNQDPRVRPSFGAIRTHLRTIVTEFETRFLEYKRDLEPSTRSHKNTDIATRLRTSVSEFVSGGVWAPHV